jgi:hypothetical protein
MTSPVKEKGWVSDRPRTVKEDYDAAHKWIDKTCNNIYNTLYDPIASAIDKTASCSQGSFCDSDCTNATIQLSANASKGVCCVSIKAPIMCIGGTSKASVELLNWAHENRFAIWQFNVNVAAATGDTRAYERLLKDKPSPYDK